MSQSPVPASTTLHACQTSASVDFRVMNVGECNVYREMMGVRVHAALQYPHSLDSCE